MQQRKNYIQMFAIFMLILLLGGSMYATYQNNLRIAKYTSWTQSIFQAESELIITHLWFEEVISGDTSLNIEADVWKHLNMAEASLKLLFASSNNIALNNLRLQEEVENTLKKMRYFRYLAQQRFQIFTNSNRSVLSEAGFPLDRQLDQVFTSILDQTSSIEMQVQLLIEEETSTFLYRQFGMFFFAFIAILMLLRTHEIRNQAQLEQITHMASFPKFNPNPILMTNSNLEIIYANNASQTTFHDLSVAVGDTIPLKWHHTWRKSLKEKKAVQLTINSKDYHYTLHFHTLPTDEVHIYAVDKTELTHSKVKQDIMASIIENTTDLITIVSISGELIYMNSAGINLLGIPPKKDITEKKLHDLLPDKERKRLKSNILPNTIKHGTWTGECSFLHADGSEVTTSTVLTCLYNEQGEPDRFSITARDMTQEKNIQHKLEHTQRLESLGVLAGGIAHDFNNILTSVMGNAALADNRLKDQHPAKEHIGRIIAASDKAATLCKQMLAYSGKGQFIIKPINLSHYVSEMIELLEVSISKNVIIRYELAESIPCIEADPAQVQQIIMNLITNANESIEEKSGVITIITSEMYVDQTDINTTFATSNLVEGQYVTLEISDTGCGMSPNIIKKIFDPFFTTKFTGRGLGMSAVMGIIRGHKGAIKLYTEIGKGSTFKLLFPVSSKSVLPQVKKKERANSWKPTGAALLIDDDESIRDTTSSMLRSIGFSTVITAEDGLKGVEAYQKSYQNIQVVLLDMTMPKLDGVATFRELRRIKPDVTVILSSGYNEQEATQRFTGKGLAGFIQKPYLPDDLFEVIHEACHR